VIHGHSRTGNSGPDLRNYRSASRGHHLCKQGIKLRAPHVHHRTVNDGHRRVPAVNPRSRLPTIASGFTQVRDWYEGCNVVVRGGVEPPTFRFSGGQTNATDHGKATAISA
jgi:hypothetical protein